jgi:hypothetical protein
MATLPDVLLLGWQLQPGVPHIFCYCNSSLVAPRPSFSTPPGVIPSPLALGGALALFLLFSSL